MSRDNKKKTNTKSRKKSPEKKKKSVIMKNPYSENPYSENSYSEHFLVNKAFEELADLKIQKDRAEEDIQTLPDGINKRLLQIKIQNLPDKIIQKSKELLKLQERLENLPSKIQEEEKSWFTKKPYKLWKDLLERNKNVREIYDREKEKAEREKIPFYKSKTIPVVLDKITENLSEINLENPDHKKLSSIKDRLGFLENFLKTQQENYTKKRKEKGSIEI